MVIKVPDFDSGVAGYVHATYLAEVFFPVDYRGNEDICCRQCPYLSANDRMCQLNKQPVAYPNKFVGQYCPLSKEEDPCTNQQND